MTLETHLADQRRQQWTRYKAFSPVGVLLETPQAPLPAVSAARLSLGRTSGNVRVFYDFSALDAAGES